MIIDNSQQVEYYWKQAPQALRRFVCTSVLNANDDAVNRAMRFTNDLVSANMLSLGGQRFWLMLLSQAAQRKLSDTVILRLQELQAA